MKRQSFIACIVCLCGIVVGLSDRHAAAVPPGSSEAQAAQSFDPFNPTPVATATTAATATSSVPNSGLIVTIAACSPASTVVVSSKPCLSVLDPATVVQSTTAKTSVTFVVTLSAKSTSTITVMYDDRKRNRRRGNAIYRQNRNPDLYSRSDVTDRYRDHSSLDIDSRGRNFLPRALGPE